MTMVKLDAETTRERSGWMTFVTGCVSARQRPLWNVVKCTPLCWVVVSRHHVDMISSSILKLIKKVALFTSELGGRRVATTPLFKNQQMSKKNGFDAMCCKSCAPERCSSREQQVYQLSTEIPAICRYSHQSSTSPNKLQCIFLHHHHKNALNTLKRLSFVGPSFPPMDQSCSHRSFPNSSFDLPRRLTRLPQRRISFLR